MQRLFILAVNCAWLVVVFIGAPAVAGVQFWHLEISSVPVARALLFWGLALATAVNAGAALFVVKGRKERKMCWLWAAVFGALLGGEFTFERGCFNFDWLKRALLWLSKWF